MKSFIYSSFGVRNSPEKDYTLEKYIYPNIEKERNRRYAKKYAKGNRDKIIEGQRRYREKMNYKVKCICGNTIKILGWSVHKQSDMHRIFKDNNPEVEETYERI